MKTELPKQGMHEKRATERSIVARNNKVKHLHVSSSLVEKSRGQIKHALRRSIRGYNNSNGVHSQIHLHSINSVYHSKWAWGIWSAALNWKINANKLKELALLKGVNPQPLIRDRLRISHSLGWNAIQSRVLDLLISRDWMWNWEVLEFALCINIVHVDRWCCCPLAMGSGDWSH